MNRQLSSSIVIIFLIPLIFNLPNSAISENVKNVIRFIDSTGSEIDSLQSVEVRGISYLPLDKVCQIFDGKLQRYEPIIGRATIQIKGKILNLLVGQTKAINAKSQAEIPLANPPLMLSGKLMVPIDFLSGVMANMAEVEVKIDRFRGRIKIEKIENRLEPTKLKSPDSTSKKGKWNLILDPGHGGKDFGAKSASGTSEKEINLKLARRMEPMLSSSDMSDIDIETYLTRDDDRLLFPTQRADFANLHRGNAFISLHSMLVATSVNSNSKAVSIYVNSATFPFSSSSEISEINRNSQTKRLTQAEFYDESWTLAKIVKGEFEARGFEVQKFSEVPLAGMRDLYMPAILVEIPYPINSANSDSKDSENSENSENEGRDGQNQDRRSATENLQVSAEALSEAIIKFFKR